MVITINNSPGFESDVVDFNTLPAIYKIPIRWYGTI